MANIYEKDLEIAYGTHNNLISKIINNFTHSLEKIFYFIYNAVHHQINWSDYDYMSKYHWLTQCLLNISLFKF